MSNYQSRDNRYSGNANQRSRRSPQGSTYQRDSGRGRGGGTQNNRNNDRRTNNDYTEQKIEPPQQEPEQQDPVVEKKEEVEVELLPSITNFDNMTLKESLLRGIYSFGFTEPALIQAKCVPQIMSKKDIIAQSQSGTGKTGAFSIGTLQMINESVKRTQAVILSPTRELAVQINSVLTGLGNFMNIKTALCIGGVKIKDNQDQLNECHIVIGTPGRIIDMIRRNSLNTSYIKILVMDEADELLSGDFKEQIRTIVQKLPKEAQICLFSATIPPEVLDMTRQFMNNPAKILMGKEELSLEGISQFCVFTEQEQWKLDTFCDIYDMITISQSMVYVNTREKAMWLGEKLQERNFTVLVIHSKMESSERSEIIKKFRQGISRVLISTDLLARGIDIQQVSVVINYDLPKNPENYLHRIGRSGRYGRKGVAINFVTSRDTQTLKDIERYYSIKIDDMPPSIKGYL